ADVTGAQGGTVPQPVANPLPTYRALHQAIRAGGVASAHDLSEGGLAVAIAEMCIGGQVGATLNLPTDAGTWFSESQGRVLVEVAPEHASAFEAVMSGAGAAFGLIGTVGGEVLSIGGQHIALADLAQAWGAPQVPSPAQPATPRPAAPVIRRAPKILVLHAPGTNRDRDAALACQWAGGAPEVVTVNQLVRGERHLLDYHMLVVPGGFSYGDDLGAGALWALTLRERIAGVDEFVRGGRPVLGICNGFQTLVKAGLLPGGEWDGGARNVTLTYNAQARFECRWVLLEANPHSPCLFTEGIDRIFCPIAHGEGRVQVADAETEARLLSGQLDALRYITPDGALASDFPFNPNGSLAGIAGLCNPDGNVFGLMPHPENHIFPWQHPHHTAGGRGFDGLRLFQNGVAHA
nr:phosphoribosylformylglycinamidine synthase I [Anaerolineae bacterium]